MSSVTPTRTNQARRPRIRRAWRLVWQTSPQWTVAAGALVVVQSTLALSSMYLMKLVVDGIAASSAAQDPRASLGHVLTLTACYGLVALLTSTCSAAATLLSGAQAQVVTDRVYDILHTKSLELDLGYYENSHNYSVFYRAQREAPFRPTRIVQGMLQLGQNSLLMIAVTGLLLSVHWGSVVVLIAAAVPGVLSRYQYAGKMYAWQRARTSTERRAWYFNALLTTDQHAKEVRLFNLGALFKRRFADTRKQLYEERFAILVRRSISAVFAEGLAITAIVGLFAFTSYRTLQGALTLGDLVMYYHAVQKAWSSLGQILRVLSDLYEDDLFLSDFDEFLNLKRTVVEPTHPAPVPRRIQRGIALSHVSFRYPGSSKRVLEDITLVIRPGEHVAFVGENGAGKTSLIKLLCRLYDPTDGSITVDDVDLRQFDSAALRREISVILQDYGRYHATAGENIWFGNIGLPLDQERIRTAAERACVGDVLARLPDGYDTPLGKWFDGGEELSVGEWQKVALARAFIRNAQIVILDEPTSALDPNTEFEVLKKFHELAVGRTSIVISHRLSTVRMADSIYVLEHGRIIESGSHKQLVRANGVYARLFAMQAQSYH